MKIAHTINISRKEMIVMEKNNMNCCGEVNKGISCDVKNCQYHQGDCYCVASKIAVGPSFATSSTETVCATFKPKKD
jgi:hypothetical protein